MTDTKQFTLSKIDAERAVVTYLNLAAKFENREEITLKRFSSCWNKLFSKGDCRFSDDMKLKAYNEAKNILGELSIAEIQEYRNSVCIFEGTQVPKDILELAKTRTKDLKVRLAQNRDKNLSGFDLLIFYNCRDTMRLNNVPFGLSEKTVRNYIESMPIKSVLVENENKLIRTLQNQSVPMKTKRRVVQKYKAPFATHKFRVFMNRFTIHDCKDKQLTNDCVALCSRCHIMNLSNMKPIEYKFCEGSGKRKATMKKVKRNIKRGKKNKKPKK